MKSVKTVEKYKKNPEVSHGERACRLNPSEVCIAKAMRQNHWEELKNYPFHHEKVL